MSVPEISLGVMTFNVQKYIKLDFYITCMELFQNKFLPYHRNGNEVSTEQPAMTQGMIHLVQSVPATGTICSIQFLFFSHSNRLYNEKPAHVWRHCFSYILINTLLFYTDLDECIYLHTKKSKYHKVCFKQYKILVRMRPYQRQRNRWEDNIKHIIRQLGSEDVNWIKTIQNKIQWEELWQLWIFKTATNFFSKGI